MSHHKVSRIVLCNRCVGKYIVGWTEIEWNFGLILFALVVIVDWGNCCLIFGGVCICLNSCIYCKEKEKANLYSQT